MKWTLFFLLFLIPVFQLLSQEVHTEELSEVVVMPVNYKYLDQVSDKSVALPVRQLEKEAANFDIRSKDIYQDDYSLYTVSFYIPDGKLVAVYNHEGRIIRTIEKFKNIDIPRSVVRSLKNHYPDWKMISDVYKVTYNETQGAYKRYKIKLKKGEKVINVKMSETGEIQ